MSKVGATCVVRSLKSALTGSESSCGATSPLHLVQVHAKAIKKAGLELGAALLEEGGSFHPILLFRFRLGVVDDWDRFPAAAAALKAAT